MTADWPGARPADARGEPDTGFNPAGSRSSRTISGNRTRLTLRTVSRIRHGRFDHATGTSRLPWIKVRVTSSLPTIVRRRMAKSVHSMANQVRKARPNTETDGVQP